MKNSKFFKNSGFSILQTIVMAVSALFLFKFMVLHAGLKLTGIWSYLSSITAITGFGSYGFANALVFYIPKYQLQHDEKKLSNLINTSFFSVLAFSTLLCILSYVVFIFIIPITIEKGFIEQAHKLLPFVILSLFFSGLSTTYLSILDGLVLMHVRAKINIVGAGIFFIAGYLLLRKVGIIGVPIAQLIQNIFLLITTYLIVKRRLPFYNFSFHFNSLVFKDIFRYGFNFQVISITQIISEPFMKSMITKYAGSNNTAIFDFCVKLMGVSRSLIISANQTIVPQITIFNTIGKYNRIKIFYKANFKLVLFISIILFLTPIALSDVISIFFLNQPSIDFNFILFSVSIGLLFNAIAFPAHFHYLGIGNLKWNVIINIVTAGFILIFTPLTGEIFGGKYVVLCWSASAVVGSIILILAFSKKNGLSVLSFLNGDIAFLILAIICSIVLNHYLNLIPVIKSSYFNIIVTNFLVIILFLLYPVFTNSTIKKIIGKVAKSTSK